MHKIYYLNLLIFNYIMVLIKAANKCKKITYRSVCVRLGKIIPPLHTKAFYYSILVYYIFNTSLY